MNQEVIEESHTGRQSRFLVRTDSPVHDPSWTVRPVSVEDLVLAYMRRAHAGASSTAAPGLEVIR